MSFFRELLWALAVKFRNRFSLILMTGVEFMILTVCLIGQTLAVFAAPIGINRILKSVIIICGSDLLFIIVSVTWKAVAKIPLFSHGSGSFGSLLGQSSEIYASSGISLFYGGRLFTPRDC